MNVRDAADILKETLTAADVARMYGMEPGRNNTMVCPFHSDRDASLHLYPGTRGWCCFGCHKGGTVIDFVMAMEDAGFTEAVRILDAKAGTGLLDRVRLEDPTTRIRRARQNSVRDAIVRGWDLLLKTAQQEAVLLTRATQEYADIPRDAMTGRDWMTWGSAIERLQELDEIIRTATNEREEARAWRPTPLPPGETIPSSPAKPSTPSPNLTQMKDRLAAAQNKLLAYG